MFWYRGVVMLNKVSEAGVKLLKCWEQLHLSNKDKCTFKERKKERKTQTNKQTTTYIKRKFINSSYVNPS
jgi:hypothetical protein